MSMTGLPFHQRILIANNAAIGEMQRTKILRGKMGTAVIAPQPVLEAS